MHPTAKRMILLASIDGQQKEISVFNDFDFSEIFHVLIDEQHIADVLRIPKTQNWQVVMVDGKSLPNETQDEILQTVLNLQYINR